MKRKYLALLIVLLGALIPTIVVYASSASCTGSNPYTCALADTFQFSESKPTITVGLTPSALADTFQFFQSGFKVAIGGGTATNIFTVTTASASNFLTYAGTIQSAIITEIVMPIVFLFIVIALTVRFAGSYFPLILGFVVFGLSGLIYVGVLPKWSIIFPILFAGVVISLLVSKWLNSQQGPSG